MPFKFALSKLSFVNVAIHQFLYSIAMLQSRFHLTFIVQPIPTENDSLAGLLSVLKIAYVLIIPLIDMFALSMRSSIEPFAVKGSKLARARIFLVDDFDTAFSISHPIFKLPQVVVLIWNILKSKSILFSLTWQIRFPISKVEGTVKIPNHIFVWLQLEINSIFKVTHNHFFCAFADVNVKMMVNLNGHFLVLTDFFANRGSLQWKNGRDLQFVGYFLSKIVLNVRNFPLFALQKDRFQLFTHLFYFLFNLQNCRFFLNSTLFLLSLLPRFQSS